MYDVLSNLSQTRIDCLDHGFVELVDVMPRLVPDDDRKTADFAIVQAARVSYGPGTKKVSEDRGLIRYLMRHVHTTPFEMVEFKFHCKMPIFVARQWIRHRTANVNEVSGRYSVLKDEFYFPEVENLRQQSKTNKQGGDEKIGEDVAQRYLDCLEDTCEKAYDAYEGYLSAGVSREQSRMILPINLYTEWYWKIDLHNLFHFLGLRCDKHAQWEIRVFADAMLSLIQPIVPFAVEAWQDYHDHRDATKLTRLEIDAIRRNLAGMKVGPLDSDNKREQAEWVAKAARLGLEVYEPNGASNCYVERHENG
jgi:thymidylate synthase (FAD)